jgi:hypothetical protein
MFKRYIVNVTECDVVCRWHGIIYPSWLMQMAVDEFASRGHNLVLNADGSLATAMLVDSVYLKNVENKTYVIAEIIVDMHGPDAYLISEYKSGNKYFHTYGYGTIDFENMKQMASFTLEWIALYNGPRGNFNDIPTPNYSLITRQVVGG